MVDSGSNQSIRYSGRGTVSIAALFIVFMMVTTSFATILARGGYEPEVWTDKDEYCQGETVHIYGEGFARWVDVDIELSHSDFGTKLFTETPDYYGKFVCDDYVAEWVTSNESVKVVVTQVLPDETLVAETEFWDPAAYIEGYTIRPHAKFTKGDIKGYYEGDTVPYMVGLDRAQLGGVDEVTVWLSFDFCDHNSPTQPVYGIDYLTEYWDPAVNPPYNIYPASSAPFKADDGHGAVTDQEELPHAFAEGGVQELMIWRFTFEFAEGVSHAIVRFGAHLAVTAVAAGYDPPGLGAAFYPGAALHVNLYDLDPSANEGDLDVPISAPGILIPPHMTLEKCCDPDMVGMGDEITFTLEWSNDGWADAACVVLSDDLPYVVDLDESSFLHWTSENPTKMVVEDIVVVDSHFEWDIGMWPGTGPDGSDPPLIGYLEFKATINTNEQGCYENWATLTYGDDHGGYYPPVEASCTFCIVGEPEIDVEKAGPLYAHVGDVVTYEYTVANTGPVDLIDIDVYDDIAGTVVEDDTLLTGETKSYTLTYTIPGGVDPVNNVVTATGEDSYGRTATDSDDWSIDILHPMIEVDKYSRKTCGEVGEEIPYMITVSNPSSDTDLYHVVVDDPLLGYWEVGTLLAGESHLIEAVLVIEEWHNDPLINTATAIGEDLLGMVVEANDCWEIDIYHPMVEVTKEANLICAEPGEMIIYWINVTNPSWDTDLVNVEVWDIMLDPMHPIYVGPIAWGHTVYLGPFYYEVPLDVEMIENIVDVIAWDAQGHFVSDSASWLVEIFHPDIAIAKWSYWECAEEGEVVEYWIEVWNPSHDATMNAVVWDLMLSIDPLWSGQLLPGAGMTLGPYPYVIPEGSEWVENLAYVEAWDHQFHYEYAEACWMIEIFHPAIEIYKWSEWFCAEEGEFVEYWIEVSNPSHDATMWAEACDPMLGGLLWSGYLAPLTNIMLGPYPYVIPYDTEWVINTAYVDAWDHQWHYVYDESTWEIEILHPAIMIDKWADLECAEEGETVLFYIDVWNPSHDTTMWTEVYDPMLGGMLWSGHLAPGEWIYLGPYPYVVPRQTEWVENWAYVWAYDYQGHDEYAEDWWIVEIFHPAIEIYKWSEWICAEEGETVYYYIDVWNPSWDATMWADVYDPMLGGLLWSGYLAPGEWIFLGPYPYVVPYDIEWVINIAYVDAWDHQWHYVYAESTWEIEILHPMIEIYKWSEWICAEEGETVYYYIDVWNPSWDATMWADVYDPMLGGLLWSGYLAPGEWVYLGPYPYVVPRDVEWIINTAYDDAWDYQGHYVYAESTWEMEIFHPMIEIYKWSEWICAEEGETVYYYIDVWNPSWDATMWADVYDPMLGGLLWSGYLAPGEWVYLGPYPYVVPYDTEWVVNTAYVDAWDHQWHYVYDESTWEMEIFHPMIEIEKWEAREFTCAHAGEEISYYINVRNPSWDTTMWADVYDPMLGGLLWSGYLAPGEWILLGPYPYVVPYGSEWVNNTAYVEAWDHQWHYVYDESTWEIEILYPSIDVTKTGPEEANIGEVITYHVYVENTGDTELYEVYVDDSLVGVIAGPLMLAIGEVVHLSYDYVVPAGEGTLDNIVTAEGRDRQYVWVCDEDSWTVYKLGEIFGFKTADLNRNGEWDEGEPGLISWVIQLTGELFGGGWDNRTRLTDGSGFYEFTGLRAGVYTVSEVMQTGWTHITVTSYTVTIGSGSSFARSFGNMPYGHICGYKWMDANKNGMWDEGEDPIPEWGIYIYGYDVGGYLVDLMTLTDENGFYCFGDLMPGYYTVYEELREGWIATTPTSVVVDVSAIEPFEIDGINFGNVKYGKITGYKWLDEWMNGLWDWYELPLEGWVIELTGVLSDGSLFGPVYTTTDENGFYCFCDLLPGTYIVREIIPEGWTHITPDQFEVTIDLGDTIFCGKFGNVEYGKIDGWKFLDWDMDGFFDGVEEGLAGWKITLEGWLNDGVPPWSTEGTYVGPFVTYTDENGYWCFDNLLPGIYKVTEESRDLWYATTPIERWIIVGSGTYVFDVKFGNVPYVCLWGYKFEDINGDGQWGEGEPGLPGWTIVIEGVQNDGVPVYWELVTDENGHWVTCYIILPGEYCIHEIPQRGWIPTTEDSYWFCVPMCPEPMDYMFLFGNFELGRICGYKYEDMNGNGILDEGDVPIAGWEMYLSGTATAMTTTDVDGFFCFDGLMYGEYTVTEESRVGWVATSPTSHTVTILSGDEPCLPVFLNVEYSRIWGYKFEDLNSNGEWDEGEPGIEGWKISMMWNEDPTEYVTYTDVDGYYEFTSLMPSDYYYVWEETPAGWTWTTTPYEEFHLTSGTNYRVHDFGNFENVDICVFKYEDVNSDGIYDKGDIPLEDWEIMVSGPGVPGGVVTLLTGADGWACVEVTAAGMYEVMELVPEGWTPTTPTVEWVHVESGYSEPECIMFGNFRDVTITLFKYEDMNSNGVFDDGDEPIAGWEFFFENEAETESFTVTTGLDGNVSVTFQSSDMWTITEMMPEDWVPVNPASGMAHVLILSGYAYSVEMEMECYYYEFGNFHCVDILVFKYWDKCSNGWYDPDFGDEPIEGWYFELRDATGALMDSGCTDENGELHFKICRAGLYYVIEEDREGWTHIDPASGWFEFEVFSGYSLIRLWFANYLDVDIPIFKYEDMNSNGVFDDGDEPIEGWYFEMTREGDDTVYSGYTDENGELVLTVNRSGVYILTEEDREGWTPINPAGGARLVSVTSGTEVPVQMFGNFEDVIIIIFKFDDRHADGQYCPEDGDSPLEGWVFELYLWMDDQWVLVATGTTDSEGYLEFILTKAGTYKVVEVLQEGWFIVMPASGEYVVEVVSGDGPIYLWFANFKLGKIFGWKWNDLDGDGMWDEGEPGLPGWTIHFEGWFWHGDVLYYLYGEDVTDENGYYEFTGLPPGMYLVWEHIIGGWVPTSPPEVEVEIIGHTEARVDFLNFEEGCIWGYKYEDYNGNGDLDDADMPLPGWTIYLYLGDSLVATTTTDGDGFYMFCGLGPGVYTVLEEARLGWIATNAPSEDVPMTSGGSIRVHDFLNFELGWIWGWKFEDLNSNGEWDEGEPAIEGWPIYIAWGTEPEVVEYTDENGYFEFGGLMAGTYTVWEADLEGWTHTTDWMYVREIFSGSNIELCPFGNFKNVSIELFKYEDVDGNGVYNEGDEPIEGWMFTVTGPCFPTPLVVYTDENGEAMVWITMAGTYVVTEEDREGWMHVNPESGSVSVDIESGEMFKPFMFGNFMLGEITGQKFYDWNLNGIKDEGETGLANWVIWINGTLVGGGYLNFTRITDSGGFYQVSGLPAGIYVVSERLEYAPAGWVPTLPTVVTVDITSGKAAAVSFANAIFGIVEGYKFYDKDLDGEWDEGEPGLAGWTIILEGMTDEGMPVYRMETTDGNGYYLFDEVQPGTYNVTEELWMNWAPTTTLPVLLDFSGAMEYFEAMVYIGNVRYAKVFGYKFLDTIPDCYPYWPNGMFDDYEHGLPDWEITLEGWTNTGVYVSMVYYTDENGYYEFTELLPGTYWVNETLLWGWYTSTPIANMIEIHPYPQGMVIFRIDFGNVLPEPDPEVPFYLREGWNLWSMPIVVDGLTASGLLDAMGPNGLVVTMLDIEHGKYKSYVAGMSLERDFPVVSGVGYFVYVTLDTAFTLKGTFESQPKTSLLSGWNFIGYSSLRPIMASELLENVEGSYGLVLTYYNEDEGKYESYIAGSSSERDFLVSSGNAYYIWVSGPCEIVFG